ncbi:MAG TPA: type I DNA topoisomerase [Polyangiales bacterium]|nr:type I DNA topoisomerase [Polyangiales bacterium]
MAKAKQESKPASVANKKAQPAGAASTKGAKAASKSSAPKLKAISKPIAPAPAVEIEGEARAARTSKRPSEASAPKRAVAPKAKAASKSSAKPKAKSDEAGKPGTDKPATKKAKGAVAKKGSKEAAAVALLAKSEAPANETDEADAAAPAEGKTKKPRGTRASTLLIVESPAKSHTIQKYLGNDYIVMASKGHIKDLPKRGGVDIENGFKETYEVIQERGKDETLRSIKENAKKVKRVLLATDPDREGEAIAWHLYEEVKNDQPDIEVRRVLFNEITKRGVQDGIDHPRDLDTNLYEAQRTRRVLDRIGGYPLSSLLWRKLTFGLSAGRVQTPALRIIVDRQHEIDSFVPRPYWLLEAGLAGENPPPFSALLDSVGGERLEKVSSRPAATSELDAKRFADDLRIANFRVGKITTRERKSRAPAPYTTSKLQQDASTRLGMQPSRAMRVAQALYEGIELGKGGETAGLITYMRTDSVRLSSEAVDACREYVEKTYGKAALPEKPNEFKTKKAQVQDAHEAIRPTRMDLPPDAVREWLTDERFKLYKLIWDRFVACQMVPAVYDQTGVDIEAVAGEKKYGLRTSGSVLRVAGWRAAYGAASDTRLAGEESEQVDDDSRSLPLLREGEVLKLTDLGIQVQAKETEPPPYFNEASLVKKLEEEGIGRPSTYAEILSKVQARDYVRKVGNKLVPSDLGKLVAEHLVRDQFDLADIAFTRKLEEDLDAIAEARGKRLDVLAPFHERLQEQIKRSLEQKGKWWPEPESINENCDECGKPLMKRWGRAGPFIGCEGYPECKYTRPLPGEGDEDRRPVLTDYKCEICESPMMKRWGRNGWFLGCSKYPECKSTRSLPLGVACPKCGGEIIEIKGKKARRPFYGCANYSKEAIKCDFRSWQKPVPEACPQCQAKFLVEAGNPKSPILRCLTEGCGYQRALPPPGESPEVGDQVPENVPPPAVGTQA